MQSLECYEIVKEVTREMQGARAQTFSNKSHSDDLRNRLRTALSTAAIRLHKCPQEDIFSSVIGGGRGEHVRHFLFTFHALPLLYDRDAQ